ncbi:MAG: esterase/lipase family protein [Desulfococcaceae bacterium]
MGVKPAGLRDAYLQINSSALSDAKPSYSTKVVLHRYNLVDRFKKDPHATLLNLHEKASGEDDRRDLRFALAELNFLYAEILQKDDHNYNKVLAPDYFLTSAVYAYMFLLGDSQEPMPGPYDNRFREACELYNRALGKGLAIGENGHVPLKAVVRKLPVGQLSLTINTNALKWDINQFERVLCADDYLVRGFTTRNRMAGMGLPLIAVKPKAAALTGERVAPMTAFLRITGGRKDLMAGTARAELELYSSYDDPKVTVSGQTVPLETDSTAHIALALDNPDAWSQGLRRFLMLEEQIDPQILAVQPYERGRIPVVFVHGTASDLVWWAEMLNTLRGDPQIRRHYQFWFFRYNSSRPVLDSGAALRRILTEKRREFDPDGTDPAMSQMVVIGHSQGGLLTKQTVVQTHDKIWLSLSDTPLDKMDLDAEAKETIRELMFIEPLPFVSRVVFISTPHRGSFLAKNWVMNVFRRIVSLPVNVVKGATSFLNIAERLKLPIQLEGKMPTSLDGMSPSNPVLKSLAAIPVEPGVTSHSIIAVKDTGDPYQSNDGVVEYRSAHLDGVVSEFIIQSGHSCQEHPLTIEEVRRILIEHLVSQTF